MSSLGFHNCNEHTASQLDNCPYCRIAELEAENKILQDKLEGMMLAYEICKDPALKDSGVGDECHHIWRNVTGQPWLKCMECGKVVDE